MDQGGLAPKHCRAIILLKDYEIPRNTNGEKQDIDEMECGFSIPEYSSEAFVEWWTVCVTFIEG